ncbi:MAG: hypothetical protein WD750_04105 [Gammaproteobacteria bacterium]
MSEEREQYGPNIGNEDIEAPEPWEPWETWLCLGSVVLGTVGLVVLGILVHRFLL